MLLSYEVELKFPVPDLAAFAKILTDLAILISPVQEEIDVYFSHPSRDFAHTDEALRLRRKGEANCITYKGPKIDATTKTRREIELPLAPGPESSASWTALLEAVGFRPAGEVRKARRKAAVPWQGRQVEASLDEVAGVGTFVEFELVAEESEVDAARACIQSLAQSLGLTQGERRSYLELALKGK
jgi:adenylate cyclase class 2